MSPTAIALVLTAALLHSVWNIAAKKAGGDDRFSMFACVLNVVIWAPVGLWAAWGVIPAWGWREWGIVLVSALLHVAYFQALLRGYRLSDLTVVYPVARGSGPLLSSFGAVLLLGERLSLAGAIGVIGVTVGVFFIAGGPGLWAKAHDPSQRARVLAGLGWAAITGAMIAGYTLVDGYAVKVMLISPILVDYFGNVLRLPVLLPAAFRDPATLRQMWRAQWKYALVVATLGPFAYVLVLYAVRLAPLSHVAPAREVSMLFAALIGGKLLGEGDRGTRIAGALCIAAGVAALALG
ncbi:MAG: DMT family transporter [Burkholderiales bacterium]